MNTFVRFVVWAVPVWLAGDLAWAQPPQDIDELTDAWVQYRDQQASEPVWARIRVSFEDQRGAAGKSSDRETTVVDDPPYRLLQMKQVSEDGNNTSFMASNPDYGFRVAKQPQGDGYGLTWAGANEGDDAEKMQRNVDRYSNQVRFHRLFNDKAGILPTLQKSPHLFELRYEEGRVVLDYERERGRIGDATGQMLATNELEAVLADEKPWLPLRYEEKTPTGEEGLIRRVVVFESDGSGSTSEIFNERDQMTARIVRQIERISEDDPELVSQMRTTHFGIAEPPLSPASNWMWWLLALLVAVSGTVMYMMRRRGST